MHSGGYIARDGLLARKLSQALLTVGVTVTTETPRGWLLLRDRIETDRGGQG